jgi:hypothetical protein
LASATEQAPPTFVTKKGGKWHLEDDYLGGWGIIVEDAKGKTKLLLRIDRAFPRKDFKKYIEDSTAGPIWETHAVAFILSLHGRPHFSVRTWWDRRILIDLEAAKWVSSCPFRKALVTFEKRHTLKILKSGVRAMARWNNMTLEKIQEIHAAADLAGRLGLKKAIPFLKQLEPVDYVGTVFDDGGDKYTDLQKGDFIPELYGLYETRRVVQRSLRLLGEKPQGYPATYIIGFGKVFDPKVKWAQRHQQVAKAKRGMKPIDILNLLGPPDYVVGVKKTWGCVWRYDMDSPKPYSLMVIWDKRPRLKGLEKVRPGLWKGKALFRPGFKHIAFGHDGSMENWYSRTWYSKAFKGKITKLK